MDWEREGFIQLYYQHPELCLFLTLRNILQRVTRYLLLNRRTNAICHIRQHQHISCYLMLEIVLGILFLGKIPSLSCTMKEALNIEGIYYI